MAEARTTGFWRGMLAGAALAAVIALGLAFAFPPMIFHDPEVGPEAQLAPERTAMPGADERPATPETAAGGLLREAAAPLIAERPAEDVPPGIEGLAPVPAPDVFDGGPAGSPSLVQPPG